jgi:hypothetical protein
MATQIHTTITAPAPASAARDSILAEIYATGDLVGFHRNEGPDDPLPDGAAFILFALSPAALDAMVECGDEVADLEPEEDDNSHEDLEEDDPSGHALDYGEDDELSREGGNGTLPEFVARGQARRVIERAAYQGDGLTPCVYDAVSRRWLSSRQLARVGATR